MVFSNSPSLSRSLCGTSPAKYFFILLLTIGSSKIYSVFGLEAGFT